MLVAFWISGLMRNALLSIQAHHVTEKKEKEEEPPTPMNAFDLISMSKGLNLGNLFDVEQVCETRFVSSLPFRSVSTG